MKKYYIVWNMDKSEGFITDDEGAALNAHLSTEEYEETTFGSSALGEKFSEYYRDEDVIYPDVEVIEL